MNQIIATKKEAEMERECCSFYYIIRDKHGDNVTIVKYHSTLPTQNWQLGVISIKMSNYE